jgi:hypothetical protein
MKRLAISAMLLAMLAAPAFAQKKENEPLMIELEEKKKAAAEVDKQYKSTLDRTRHETTATHTDPWSNMRGADDSKTKR